MSTSKTESTIVSLESIRARHLGRLHRNLPTAALVEDAMQRREAHLTASGAVAVYQGQHTERALDATYVAAGDAGAIDWLVGERYEELTTGQCEGLSRRLLAYLRGCDLYVQDLWVGSGEGGEPLRCRLLTQTAWHALMARTLYRPAPASVADGAPGEPQLTVVHAPGFQAVPAVDGTRSAQFTLYYPSEGLAYVGGSAYGGELRKAVIHLADAASGPGVLPLRGAVSVGPDGDAALFLGRTGTGKTTLALDEGRRLLADHAVGWGESGLVGFERGAYASVLGLDSGAEPVVHRSTGRFGSVLENVAVSPADRTPDFADASLAMNTRAAFRVEEGAAEGAKGGQSGDHPKHIFLLTRDTAGVLPPIARLTPDQAVFAFLISYTSSLADTEAGQRDVHPDVDTALGETTVAVSPAAYAKRFAERIAKHSTTCWFVNTGWVGEPADRGQRVDLTLTRALVRAALAGELDSAETEPDPLFLFEVVRACPGVDETLTPRELAEDPAEYEIRANLVATAFIDAFAHFEEEMPPSVAEMVDSVVLFEETLDVLENFRLSF